MPPCCAPTAGPKAWALRRSWPGSWRSTKSAPPRRRPAYQIPRFAPAVQKGRQLEAELVAAAATARKPAFPADDMGQTAAVMAALASADGPVDAATLAAGFRQGRRVEPKIAAVLLALARMGFAASADDGRTLALRRAA